MDVLAAEAVIGLAVVAVLGTLLVVLLRRRRRAAIEAETDQYVDDAALTDTDPSSEPAPAPLPQMASMPQRRRTFGPGSAAAMAEAEAALDEGPSIPAFVAAARAAARAADDAVIEAEPLAIEPEPAPPPPPQRHPALVDALSQAVVFRQDFPPRPEPARSGYGGVPLVPGDFAWPRSEATGLPLHFLLQIDCAAVPAEAGLAVLPTSGALLFFADLSVTPGANAAGAAVLVEAAPGASWQECPPPDDLPPAYADAAPQAWPWSLDAADAPQVLPRWPFTPVPISLTAAAYAPGASPLVWPETAATADALLAAQSYTVAVYAMSPNDFAPEDGGLMRRPWPGFPHDWLAVQTLVALLGREAARQASQPVRSLWPDLTATEFADMLARIEGECGEWHALARTKSAFAELPEPVRDAFWEWFSGYAPLATLIAPRGCVASVETTLHVLPQKAGRFPDELVARLGYRHALAVRTASRVHARIPDRLLAAPSQTENDQSGRVLRELLLLELAADEALGHHFGDHALQFWIGPDDLAAGRLDKAQMVIAPV